MLVVGIAGGTGSGKTTVVRKIVDLLPENRVIVLPQDNYYRDNSHLPLAERHLLNFDHPASIEFELLVEHVTLLKSGQPIHMPFYSYLTCTRQHETLLIQPNDVLIVEGILIMTDENLRNCMDIKVYVDADADDRLIRCISRDILERGRSIKQVLDRYEKTVKPMHQQFIEPTKRFADIIVPQGGNNDVAINVISSMIRLHLHNRD
ncbi:MAG: uridine kinase [Sphingobacteriales bacterium]|nr:MAG: uridine kinase [Sphingobacteriales bacterium]